MKPTYYENVSFPVVRTYLVAEDELLSEIVKKAKVNAFSSSDDKLAKSQNKGRKALTISALAILSKTSRKADKVIDEVVKKVAIDTLIDNGYKGDLTGRVVEKVVATKGELKKTVNLLNSTMYTHTMKSYDKLASLIAQEQAKTKVIGEAVESIIEGKATFDTAVRNAVRDMADEGITAFVDKLGRNWSVESYTSMVTQTNIVNYSREVTFAGMQDNGDDIIFVEPHAGSRPQCEPYQNKYYSLSGNRGYWETADGQKIPYESIYDTSYQKEPAGLFMINCRHSATSIKEKFSFDRRDAYDVSKEENDRIYKLQQAQRRIEEKIRNTQKSANKMNEFKKGWGSEAQEKANALRKEYREYCKQNDLRPRNERLWVL